MESFRLTLTFVFIILALPNILALCEEGKVDINTASLKELDSLQGIGPIKAQAIIDSRPFASLDDLINVNGIGQVTLDNIKSQELACVSGDEKEEETVEEDKGKNSSDIKEIDSTPIAKIEDSSPKEIKLQGISLNPKAIKSDIDSEVSSKRNYAFSGLIAFGVLLGLLFLIKKKKYKNEFE